MDLSRSSAVAWMMAASAHAQVSGWLDFNGQVPGESKAQNHLNWIEIQGFQISGAREAGRPGAFGMSKYLDRASPKLFLACAQGTVFPKATLDLNYTTSIASPPGPARIVLEDVLVVSYGIGSGGDRPAESFDLAFGKITYTYYLNATDSVISDFDYRNNTGSSGTGSATDSDGDGMPDAWEASFGLAAGSNDANEDADGDGFTNLQEYQLGTHPKSGASFFKVTVVPLSGSPGIYQLTWTSVVGKAYVIEWSPDLKIPFTTLREVTATATTTSDNVANAGSIGFYRVRLR